jgi:hypothetical protein
MKLTYEISLGSLIQIVMLAFAIVKTSIKFGELEQKVNIMYYWFQSTVIRQQKLQVREPGERFSEGD